MERLHLLLTGSMRQGIHFDARPTPGARVTDDGWPFSAQRFVDVPVVAFLAEHADAGLILIDTGLHPSVAEDPRGNLGRVNAFFMAPRMRAGQGVRAQLATRGLDPDLIALVVLTHLHADHASGVTEFPRASFVVTGEEWHAATAEGDRIYRRSQFDHPFDWHLFDHATSASVPVAGFGRGIDLLGDGSVVLLSTPGHSRGHQSVLVRLADREILIAADAALTARALARGTIPMYLDDEGRFRRSLEAIRGWAAGGPRRLVIPGHDGAHWRTLELSYR